MAFHGVQVLYESITPPSVRTVDASTIFVVGTAPGALVTGKFGHTVNGNNAIRYNHPFLLTQRTDAPTAALGTTGTLPAALDSIFAQGNFKVVMVIVEEGAAVTAKNAYDFDVETYEETISPVPTGKVWHFEAATRQLRFYNLVTADNNALDALRVGDQITASKSGTLHTTWTVEVVDTVNKIVRVASGFTPFTFTDATAYDLRILASAADDGTGITRTNAIGSASDLTGIYAAHAATSVLGRNALPRLLCAPGIDTGSRPGGAANPLAAAMVTVAEQIKAMAIIDGPNTTHAAAIEYIGDFDSSRAIVVDPAVLVADADGNIVARAASGFVAGVIARTDYEIGWWASPSNKPIRGIVGTARPIDAGHPASRAQLLLDNKIWTIVNDVGGFQLWGTDTPATTEPDYSFPNIQRTADILGDSIQRSHRWAVARGITKNYLSAVSQSVNDFIRTLVARGALSGGLCYPDPALNTPANIALGQAYFNVEWTGTYPANSIVFKMQLTTKYLESLAA